MSYILLGVSYILLGDYMKIIKYLGLFLLICFTFFYTEKVVNVINNNDELMIDIKDRAINYEIEAIDAVIDNDTIIPGKYGKVVNIDKSYYNMKSSKVFNDKLLFYDIVKPNISLKDNNDKYIIGGNPKFKNVSLIYILNNNIESNINLINSINYRINIFLNYEFMLKNINMLNSLNNHDIYNYGNDGIYTEDNVIMGNNIINNRTNNRSIYCLARTRNDNTINMCSKNRMYTIIPSIDRNYSDIKSNIKNGSIIMINNIKELDVIVNYINSKGYNIVSLSELLSEEIK